MLRGFGIPGDELDLDRGHDGQRRAPRTRCEMQYNKIPQVATQRMFTTSSAEREKGQRQRGAPKPTNLKL